MRDVIYAQKNVPACLHLCPPTQQFILTTAIIYVCSGSVNNTGLIKYTPL